MKIMICTSKVRPDGMQTNFPPYGAMPIVQTLIKSGYTDTALFDIDGLRPPYSEVIAHFQRERPEVVGISGIVSTAYGVIKRLIATIHEVLPETHVLVGGNVAANSEILLRLAKADYCVVGEGERTIVELMSYLKEKGGRSQQNDFQVLRGITGITFIDDNDVAVFTGYQPDLPAHELYDLDYDVLQRNSDINLYIIDPWYYEAFKYDPRSYESHRGGKKLTTLLSTKGCVAKCTFCHRWDKGIRFVPVDLVIERIKMLQKRYNVGFISFGDENWGSNRKWVDELLEKIASLDVLWRVGGVRCRTVSLEMLKRMRDAGCVNVQFGMESGSQRMLDVMEKNTKVQQNVDAAKWTYEAGLYTVYALVFGMPGESPETVRETIDFMKGITEFLPEPPYYRLSINRIEALPGTPVYQYGQVQGLMGRKPEEEEKYLVYVSNIEGGDWSKQLNFTDYPEFILQSWPRLIWLDVINHWYKKNPQKTPPLLTTVWATFLRLLGVRSVIDPRADVYDRVRDPSKGRDLIDKFVDKDFNAISSEFEEYRIRLRYHPSLYGIMRRFIVLPGILKCLFSRDIPKRWWFEKLVELLVYHIKGPRKSRFSQYKSMRATMKEIQPEPLTESEKNLVPLQLGR